MPVCQILPDLLGRLIVSWVKYGSIGAITGEMVRLVQSCQGMTVSYKFWNLLKINIPGYLLEQEVSKQSQMSFLV